MNKNDILTIVAGAVLAYVAYKTLTGKKSGSTAVAGIRPASNGATATEIMNNADPTEPGWGWKYYTDGTAISPAGDYYRQGQLIWSQP